MWNMKNMSNPPSFHQIILTVPDPPVDHGPGLFQKDRTIPIDLPSPSSGHGYLCQISFSNQSTDV